MSPGCQLDVEECETMCRLLCGSQDEDGARLLERLRAAVDTGRPLLCDLREARILYYVLFSHLNPLCGEPTPDERAEAALAKLKSAGVHVPLWITETMGQKVMRLG